MTRKTIAAFVLVFMLLVIAAAIAALLLSHCPGGDPVPAVL